MGSDLFNRSSPLPSTSDPQKAEPVDPDRSTQDGTESSELELDRDSSAEIFDRETAIPALPPDRFAAEVMAAAKDPDPKKTAACADPRKNEPARAELEALNIDLAFEAVFSYDSPPRPGELAPEDEPDTTPGILEQALPTLGTRRELEGSAEVLDIPAVLSEPPERPSPIPWPSEASTRRQSPVPRSPPLPRTEEPLELDLKLDSLTIESQPLSSALGLADMYSHDPPPTSSSGPPVATTPPPSMTRGTHKEMQDRYAVGDFTGALVIADSLLENNPDDPDATRYAQSCREVLTQMYAARLGPLDQVASIAVSADQIRWLSLDHRAGFLLSLVDGMSTVEEILDISGMPRLDALRIMYTLTQQKVVILS